MTLRINLLPHRERKRKERREQLIKLAGLVAILACVVIFGLVVWRNAQIDTQRGVNELIKAEIDKLDTQIADIAKLKDEIQALRARQGAVESLQVDRNQPVRVFDELVKQIPEGAYLKAIKQEGKRITLVGLAQSQERVSEILRNIGNQAIWLDTPDLIEIKSVAATQNVKDSRKVFEFAMTVGVKDKPRVVEQVTPAASPAKNDSTLLPKPDQQPAPVNGPTVPAPRS